MDISRTDNRRTRRYELKVPAVLEAGAHKGAHIRLKNISIGGACFESATPPQEGAHVSIRFIFKDSSFIPDTGSPHFEGRVVRSEAGSFAVVLGNSCAFSLEKFRILCAFSAKTARSCPAPV